MDESEKVKQRQELLKMARDLLIEDYINKRAMEHNKWVEENDEMWRSFKRRVPYPAFTPYPTDKDIVSAAETLCHFAFNDSEEVKSTETGTSVVNDSISSEPVLAKEEYSTDEQYIVPRTRTQKFLRSLLWLSLTPYRILQRILSRLSS